MLILCVESHSTSFNQKRIDDWHFMKCYHHFRWIFDDFFLFMGRTLWAQMAIEPRFILFHFPSCFFVCLLFFRYLLFSLLYVFFLCFETFPFYFPMLLMTFDSDVKLPPSVIDGLPPTNNWRNCTRTRQYSQDSTKILVIGLKYWSF